MAPSSALAARMPPSCAAGRPTARAPCAPLAAPQQRHARGASAAHHRAARRAAPPPPAAAASDEDGSSSEEAAPRDDDLLPDSLSDALADSAAVTCLALDRGAERCVVEVLLPEFWDPLSGPIYAEEGDQQRFWKLTRRFVDELAALRPSAGIRAVYPDAGVAAMLRNQWTDAAFSISSLNDRKPTSEEDDIIILASPDPQGLDDAVRISRGLAAGQALVMFNPRLASGDVGVGLNVRRMRENFLSGFATTYSLRPIGDVGSVFRRYPGPWQVFLQDPAMPGRYKLAAERATRPGGEDLDLIVMQAMEPPGGGADGEAARGAGGVAAQIGLVLRDVQRFMRSLSQ